MRKLILFLLLLTSSLIAKAQQVGDYYYIYRNDGQFNAFFSNEIDSMTFSNYDADSILYDEVVTQVVYTADSIYRIPLAVVDSVSFVTPKTIVNNDVFALTSEHSPFISQADTSQFVMALSTPASLMPKVGNIVVATADCDAFADGIVARVENIRQSGSGYLYICSVASIDEVFDQLLVHTAEPARNLARSSHEFDLRRASFTDELWNKKWSKTFSAGATTTTLNVADSATVVVTVRKTLTTPFYFQVQLQNDLASSISFNAAGHSAYSKQVQIGNTLTAGKITVPYTAGFLWFAPKLSLDGYFEEEGEVTIDLAAHFDRSDRVVFTYTNGKWTFDHTPLTDMGFDVAQLNMEGHAEIGLVPQIDLSLNGTKAGFGMRARAGIKEYVNFTFDMTKLADGTLYDALRDSYCRTTLPWQLTAHASVNIFQKYNRDYSEEDKTTFTHTFEPTIEPRWGDDRYIFPLFSQLVAYRHDADKTKAEAEVAVSRTPLIPVKLGFALLDKTEQVVQTSFAPQTYCQDSLFGNYTLAFNHLVAADDYSVRPMVRLMGYDVLASPAVKVDIMRPTCPDDHHPHFIDLGLPSGTLWACCNVGATKPQEQGSFYAWGEVTSKNCYNWGSYQYTDERGEVMSLYADIAGTEYDAATYNWGMAWQMPTVEQLKELVENTTSQWTVLDGVKGLKFTAKNGNILFLPAAGCRWDYSHYDAGVYGNYWSSIPYQLDSDLAWYLYFDSGLVKHNNLSGRDNGQSIRPCSRLK